MDGPVGRISSEEDDISALAMLADELRLTYRQAHDIAPDADPTAAGASRANPFDASFSTRVYTGVAGDTTWGAFALNEALIAAIANGDVGAAEAQLAAGAEPNAKNAASHTPLHVAIAHGAALVEVLVAAGAKVDTQDKWGRAPVHWCCKEGVADVLVAMLPQDETVACPVLDKGDEDMRTPVHIAAAHGHTELLKVMHKRGANLEALDSIGSTPLHLAAEAGHGRACGYLIERGRVDINVINSIGNTALHRAARRGQFDVIWSLLAYGADDGPVNDSGQSARDLADKAGHGGARSLLSPSKEKF